MPSSRVCFVQEVMPVLWDALLILFISIVVLTSHDIFLVVTILQ